MLVFENPSPPSLARCEAFLHQDVAVDNTHGPLCPDTGLPAFVSQTRRFAVICLSNLCCDDYG